MVILREKKTLEASYQNQSIKIGEVKDKMTSLEKVVEIHAYSVQILKANLKATYNGSLIYGDQSLENAKDQIIFLYPKLYHGKIYYIKIVIDDS